MMVFKTGARHLWQCMFGPYWSPWNPGSGRSIKSNRAFGGLGSASASSAALRIPSKHSEHVEWPQLIKVLKFSLVGYNELFLPKRRSRSECPANITFAEVCSRLNMSAEPMNSPYRTFTISQVDRSRQHHKLLETGHFQSGKSIKFSIVRSSYFLSSQTAKGNLNSIVFSNHPAVQKNTTIRIQIY